MLSWRELLNMSVRARGEMSGGGNGFQLPIAITMNMYTIRIDVQRVRYCQRLNMSAAGQFNNRT